MCRIKNESKRGCNTKAPKHTQNDDDGKREMKGEGREGEGRYNRSKPKT